jgi:hypothetical protein
VILLEDKLVAIEKFCEEREGTFALGVSTKGGWSGMLNFGREAPDSPMVGGSAIGSGETAEEAIDGVIEEAHIEVKTDPSAVITFTEDDEGTVNLSATFDPPVSREAAAERPADLPGVHYVALGLLEHAAKELGNDEADIVVGSSKDGED